MIYLKKILLNGIVNISFFIIKIAYFVAVVYILTNIFNNGKTS
jgi:hypothetical protein